MSRRSHPFVLALTLAILAVPLVAGTVSAAKTKGTGGGGIVSDPNLVCGDTITRSTALTKDYDCADFLGDAAFFVTMPGLTIDLAGFTVIAPYGKPGVKIGADNVSVRNGTVRAASASGSGVSTTGRGTTISKLSARVTADAAGIACVSADGYRPASVSLSGVTLVGGWDGTVGGTNGLETTDCGVVVSSSTATGFRYCGFSVVRGDPGYPVSATFTGVAAYANRCGVYGGDIPMSVSGSNLHHNRREGILHEGNANGALRLQSSTLSGNGWDGARLYQSYSDGTSEYVVNNVFSSNGGGGAYSGLYIGFPAGGAVIKGNIAEYNGFGFYSDNDGAATSSGNTARYNVFQGFYGAAVGWAGLFSNATTDRCLGNGSQPEFFGNWTCVVTTR